MLALAACARTMPPAPVVSGGQPSALPAPVRAAAIAPTPQAPPPPAAAPSAPPPQAATPQAPHPDTVTVQSGETLYAISRRYDVPVRSLIEANALAPPYGLNSGRTLVVPKIRQHVVQAGETLYSVSRLYGVDTSTLAHANAIEAPYVVRLGQPLLLPAPVEMVAVAAEAPSPREPPPVAAPPGADEKIAALPPPPQGSGRSFLWPVHGRVVGRYGNGEGGTRNDGINIAAPEGTSVVAADAGTVAYAGNELRGYGNLVLIKHADGWLTAYAHNAALQVKRGDRVRRGQAIARVGATGAVGVPQLHFEIRHGARAIDPGDYLPPAGATASR